jgi:hypothetical protein
MKNAAKPWPPIIVAEHEPRWVKWRDFFLTLMMWVLFAIMLETEFELFVGPYLEHLGLGEYDSEGNWDVFFERLMPFVQIDMMLIGLLALASLITLYRRRRSLLLPPPPLLAIADEARRTGMDEAELAAARDLRNVVVYIDEDGTHRVKPRGPDK